MTETRFIWFGIWPLRWQRISMTMHQDHSARAVIYAIYISIYLSLQCLEIRAYLRNPINTQKRIDDSGYLIACRIVHLKNMVP